MNKKGFTYTLQIDAEINDLILKTNQVKKSMESVMAAGKAPEAEKVFKNIEHALEKLQQKASQPIESVSAFSTLEKDSALVGAQLKKLGSIIEGLKGLDIQDKMDLIPADLAQKIEKASAALKAYKTAEAEASQKIEEHILISKKLAKAKEEEAAALEKADTKQKLYTMQSKTAEAAKAEVDAIKRKIEALKEYQAAADEVRKKEGDTANVSKAVPIGKIKAAQQAAPQLNLGDASAVDGEIEQLATALATASKNATAASATLREYQAALDKANNTWVVASEKVEELDAEQKRLDNDFENNKAKKMQTAYSALREEADKLGIDLTEIPIEYTEQNFIKLNAALNQLTVDGIAKVDQSVNNLQAKFDETNATAEDFGNTMQGTGEKVEKLDETVSNATAFTERIKQFVGLQGAAMIARRALSDAIQTVKELDQVMTEMAVVTDAGIGDYWSQLSEHTERANGLGLAIKDVYKAETLYYQQGLKTNEVVAMSNETLKMARIAGLSAEDATNKMTAALRGFNMELNETSAQKVADVYSELAAITASDVNEISSAMTKTASIAASAGMEFETTAAFLSQIIETTRESAETAGTALKTVIARFQELKKDPSEIGEVDGEIVDANKIETALRSVGVALRDSSGQFRELDDVFLELSSKWDSLDTNTQRYIATIAAGSRQQSRFIAMMSDYSRTQELVTAANSSAGASNKQFEKTMDSLESKLNELKNAWSEFTMGIMNSSFVKFGVEVLTTLLNIINNITKGLQGAGGFMEKFTGALSKIGVIVTIVKLGEAVVNKMFTALTNKAVAMGQAIGEGIVRGTKTGLEQSRKEVEKAKTENTAENKDQQQPPNQVQEEMKKQSSGLKGIAQGVANMMIPNTEANDASQKQIRAQAFQNIQGKSGSLSEALGKNGKKMQSSLVSNKTWKSIEGQFKQKMKNMGASTEQINKAWDKAAKKIEKNKTVSSVIKDLDKELGTTADALDQKLGIKTQDKIKSIGTELLDVSDEVGDLGKISEDTAVQLEKNTSSQIAGYDQLSTSLTNTGMALTGIGVACGAVGAYFEGMGLSGVADAFNNIGTVVTTVGGIMTGIGSVLTFLKPMFASTITQAYAIAAGKNVESAGWFASAVGAIAAQTAMSPVLIITLLLIAAILTLVIAIVALVAIFKAIKAASPEGQLESARGAADAAAEAADRAAEAYNNLADSFENLADKYDALDDLTRGTQEWRDAVKEVNTEVLDLIEKYPEHAGLVENKNGVLTLNIDSKEVQGVLNKYEKQSTAAMNASLAAKINVNEKQAKVSSSNIADKNMVTVGDYSYSLSDSTMEKMATAMHSGGDLRDLDGDGSLVAEMTEWLKANGSNSNEIAYAASFAQELANDIEALKEFGIELDAMAEQERIYKQQMAQNAIDLVDETQHSAEAMQQMNVAATSDFADSFTDRYEEQFANMDKNSEEVTKAKEDVAKNLYGEDATVSGNKITYTDENGEKQTKELTDEEFKEQWAAIQATEAMRKAFEQLPKTIDKISNIMTDSAGKAFRSLYAGTEGSGMTRADVEAETYSYEQMRAIWGNLSLEEQEAYGTFENLWKQYSDSLAAGQEAFRQAQDSATEAGIDVIYGVTLEAARGYSEQMRHIYLLNGKETAEQLDKQLQSITSSLSETEKTSFISALNALDWTNIDSLESLPETLEAMNISIDEEALENYIDLLAESGKAIQNIDVNKIKEAATALTNLSKDISGGSQGRSFSEEAYKALIEMSPELAAQFQQGLDGQYTYLGSSLDKLTKAIQDNTHTLLLNATQKLSNQIAMAEITTNMSVKQGNRELSFADLASGVGSEETMQAALTAYQKNIEENNAEIVGIKNFGNDTVVEDLSLDEMKAIFTELNNSASKLADYNKEYTQTAVEAAAVLYQKNSAVDNAYGVSMADSYATSSTSQRQEFDARSATLMVQSNAAGIDSNLISQYASLVEQYKNGVETTEEGKDIYEELLVVQTELANATDYSNMRKGLQEVFESAASVVEEYDKLAQGDYLGKINTANQALAKFGIEVTDATQADMYMDLLDQVTQGNSAALSQLVGIAQEQAGIAINKTGNAYSDGWSTLSEEQLAFFNQMEKAQLGYWEKTGEDTKQFVWATTDELQSIAEAAGTAIEAWESPYTWLYNYNEEINRLIREREKAERAYTKALEDENSTTSELLEQSKQQLATLQEQASLASQSAANAMSSIETDFANNADFAKYVEYNATTGAITVDFEGIEAANFNETEQEEFEAFVSSIEENRDIILDAEDTLEDIEDDIKEIENRGRDETSDTMNKIKDGLVMERQKEIDSLQTIKDSIQEAQSALINKIQEQIDDARQARENEKTEQEITDKETRLAYLMQDTSGGNALEIAALQKEIAEQKEGYTDSLVDQQLQNLQDANEAAAEQRQQQIDIAQAQLDAYANSEDIWQEVQNILLESQRQAAASNDFASGWMNTSAYKYQAMADGIDSLNPIEKDIKKQELAQNGLLSSVYTGITTNLTGDINDTTEAVNNAKGAINDIKTNAGTFGKIDNTHLTTAIEKITGKTNGVGLNNINESVNGVKSGVEAVTKPSDLSKIFESPIKTQIVENVSTEDTDSANEKAQKEKQQKEAIQKGITAVSSFSSGGDEMRNRGNAAYEQAKQSYEAAGGTNFDQAVNDAFENKSSEYDYGEHYDSNEGKITTGTFPNTTLDKNLGGNGGGDYDQWGSYITFTFGNGWKIAAKVPQNVNGVSESLNNNINQLYANEGLTPGNGWVVLYKKQPYVFNNGWWRSFAAEDQEEMRKHMLYMLNPHYKTGGLADFTGPAWLDGTKSKPELVLNQTDTANFIQLKDILADILHGTSTIRKTDKENKGDNYYDIEINVEKIEDDYDVEQMAEKIKNMIYEDSVYRNVNLINNIH